MSGKTRSENIRLSERSKLVQSSPSGLKSVYSQSTTFTKKRMKFLRNATNSRQGIDLKTKLTKMAKLTMTRPKRRNKPTMTL